MILDKIYLKRILTKNLSNKELLMVVNLKRTHWKYSLKSQLKWIKQNSLANDNHFLLLKDKELIGYVHLGLRTLENAKIKKKYILFRNLIIKNNFRKKNFSGIIMRKVNNYILSKKKSSFLVCKKSLLNFYKKNNWNKVDKKKFLLMDHNYNNMCLMSYNLNTKKETRFYYYK